MELRMIGLGRMRGNMALRLLRAGHRVVAYDPWAEAVQALAAQGGHWSFADPLLRAWEEQKASPVQTYKPGSWGPAAADALLAQDGRGWQRSCGAH